MKFSFEGTQEEFRSLWLTKRPPYYSVPPIPVPVVPEEAVLEEGEPEGHLVDEARKLTSEERERAIEVAYQFIMNWAENFGQEGPQPDRPKLMEDMGSGRDTIPFLLLCYEENASLQSVCERALRDAYRAGHASEEAWWMWVDQIACNLTQLSAITGFPDLGGTYDYSERWKRLALGGQ